MQYAVQGPRGTPFSFVLPKPEDLAPPTLPDYGDLDSVKSAPTFRPTRLEWSDPMNYIASISENGEVYGICRIVPPDDDPQWTKPKNPDSIPPSINDIKFGFRTKVQNIHQLQHRGCRVEAFHQSFHTWTMDRQGHDDDVPMLLDQHEIDLWNLLVVIYKWYGADPQTRGEMNWTQILEEYLNGNVLNRDLALVLADNPGDDILATCVVELEEIYVKYLLPYEFDAQLHPEMMWQGISEQEIRNFGYSQGDVWTLQEFVEKSQELAESLGLQTLELADIEKLYWKIVEQPRTQLQVEYGSDLSVVAYGSGFTSDPSDPMSTHPWNLNILPKVPNSLFHYTKEIVHGVTDPMLYCGMPFSSFAWHVEDNFLYSINYLHCGAPKVWYGCGSQHAVRMEQAMRDELPELFEKHPDLLHQLVTMVSPVVLKKHNVPIFRAVQNAGEFVITFPRGYHAGFNSNFNIAEAVNFAMPDWIPFGVDAIADYRQTKRKVAYSHEELILSVARSFPISSLTVSLLFEVYRLTKEYERLRFKVKEGGVTQIDLNASESSKLEGCSQCLAACYLGGVRCKCSPSKIVCLQCADQLPCQGRTSSCLRYLYQRVSPETLRKLIMRLETRLLLPKMLRLKGISQYWDAKLARMAGLRKYVSWKRQKVAGSSMAGDPPEIPYCPKPPHVLAPGETFSSSSDPEVIRICEIAEKSTQPLPIPPLNRFARKGGLVPIEECDLTLSSEIREKRRHFVFVEDYLSLRSPIKQTTAGGGEVIIAKRIAFMNEAPKCKVESQNISGCKRIERELDAEVTQGREEEEEEAEEYVTKKNKVQ